MILDRIAGNLIAMIFISDFCVLLATGRVLALELPKQDNQTCTVLYPASVKAGNEIGNAHALLSDV